MSKRRAHLVVRYSTFFCRTPSTTPTEVVTTSISERPRPSRDTPVPVRRPVLSPPGGPVCSVVPTVPRSKLALYKSVGTGSGADGDGVGVGNGDDHVGREGVEGWKLFLWTVVGMESIDDRVKFYYASFVSTVRVQATCVQGNKRLFSGRTRVGLGHPVQCRSRRRSIVLGRYTSRPNQWDTFVIGSCNLFHMDFDRCSSANALVDLDNLEA